MVGMTAKDLQKAVQAAGVRGDRAQCHRAGEHLPAAEGHHREHREGLQHSATSKTGYGSQRRGRAGTSRRPTGRTASRPFANAYGDCGLRTLVLTGPRYQRWDISAVKRTQVVGHTMLEFRADMINAFNHPNFTPVGLSITSTTTPPSSPDS